jgi:hypothetical protein
VTLQPGLGGRTTTLSADGGLPSGPVPAGAPVPVRISVRPAHPATVVELQVDDGRGRTNASRATRRASADGATWHAAEVPSLPPGRTVRYRVVATQAGREVAALPADGSWITATGTEQPAVVPPVATATSAAPPSQPRWSYDLGFFAALTVDLRAEVLGETPDGYRINFFVRDGWVRGPRIDARLLPEGGDWMCIRPDGIGEVDITITYQTSGGALIMERSGGVFDLGPGGYEKVRRGDFSGTPPFYATPTWVTADPEWAWLNRCQGFGIGRVVLEELQVRCDIYLPAVGGPLGPGAAHA